MTQTAYQSTNPHNLTSSPELDALLNRMSEREATLWRNLVHKETRTAAKKWLHGIISDAQYSTFNIDTEIRFAQQICNSRFHKDVAPLEI